ncbi:MAG: hypothetical protein U5L09_14760 [Bacteroidales bacterium]|nr:hypothetical protein [Bacteroidales bacterium]
MVWFIRVALVAGLMAVSFTGTAQSGVLVCQDEFDGNGLPDDEKWGYDIGGSGWGNNELQYYTQADTNNARVEDGKLIIEAHKETYSGNNYTLRG